MKEYFTKIVRLSLILPVSFAAILCCHFSKGQAVEVGSKIMPACHPHSAKTTPVKGDDCSCCINQIQADSTAKISLTFPQPTEDFLISEFLIQHQGVFKPEFNLAFLDGPPLGPFSDAPLYIHFHNFRI